MRLASLRYQHQPIPYQEEEKAMDAERPATQELCDAILNALGRDERLRRDYLRRRWRGLIVEAGAIRAAAAPGEG